MTKNLLGGEEEEGQRGREREGERERKNITRENEEKTTKNKTNLIYFHAIDRLHVY